MPVIGNVDIYTGSVGQISADELQVNTIKPKPGTDTIDIGTDATASIGLITASAIEADAFIGTIKPKPGDIDPCCVYVTGSSTTFENRLRSIQPKNSTHDNQGQCSVINGGNLHSIDANTQFGGIQSGFSSSLSQQYGSNIAGGSQNKITPGAKGRVSASAILGGANNVIDGSEFSAILGGSLNCIVNHSHSFVLGHSIEATASCTTFTNCLNIQTIDQAVPGDHLLTRHTESGLVRQGPSISQVEGDVFFTNTLLNPDVDVYRTGSSGVASISTSSIQPFFTTHNNSGHFSVIGGGDNHCITDSLSTGTPFHDGIFSGKDNCILDVSSTFIGGGFKNLISSPSSGSVIGGGVCNQIEGDFTSGNESIIVGGRGNCLKNTSRAFIGGGQDNTISSSLESSIVGGDSNTLRTAGLSSIAGGQGNCITDVANAGFIGGGIENQITSKTSASYDTIVNGNCNEIDIQIDKGNTGYNFIGNGGCNTIISSSEYGAILNGRNNIVDSNLGTSQVLSSSFNTITNGTSNHICATSIFNGGRNFIGNGSNHLISEKASFDTIVNGQSNRISSNSPNSLLFTTYLNSSINGPEVSTTSSLFEVNNFNVSRSSGGSTVAVSDVNPTSTTSGAPLNNIRASFVFKRSVIPNSTGGAYDRIGTLTNNVGAVISRIGVFVDPGTIIAPGDTFTFSSQSLSSNLPNGTDLILTLKEGAFSLPTSSFDEYPTMFTNVTGSVGTYRVLVSPQNAPASPVFSASITLDAQNNISEFIPFSMGSLSGYSNTVIGATFTIPSESIGYGAGVQGTDALLTIQNSTVFQQYVTNNGNSDVRSNLIGNGAGNIIRGRTSYNTILNGINNNICVLVPSGSIDFNSILGGSGNEIDFVFGKDICNNTIIGGESNKIGAHDPISPAYCSSADTLQGNLIGGGTNNQILDSERSTILNGDENKICQDSFNTAILGGYQNSIASRAENGVIINGKCQRARAGARYSIAAGFCNLIAGGANEGFIGGGRNNTVCNASYRAGILGGCQNVVNMGKHSAIAGGDGNRIYGRNTGGGTGPLCNPRQQCNSFIGGGKDNRIGRIEATTGHSNAIVMGLANDIEKQGVCHNLIGTGQQNQIKKFVEESSIVAGGSNIIEGTTLKSSCRSSVLGGFGNTVSSSVDSSIMGGRDNCIQGLDRTFIIGSNLTADRACTTFVNSLDISSSLDFTLSEIPTSDVGLRQGQLYRTGSNFDELRIKL